MQNLGHADPVLEKLLQFADFNDNGEVRVVTTVLELWGKPPKKFVVPNAKDGK